MADRYVETTSEGWGSRLKNALGGIVAGVVMTVLSFILLFWNEGRAVKRQQTLQEGAGIVVSVAADRVDPTHEGRLIHVSGTAEAKGELADVAFGVSAPNALKLKRTVEMYQWVENERTETRNKVGGGTERVTTYEYDRRWLPELKASSAFKQPAGHENPPALPFPSLLLTADPITLGAFTLPEFFVAQLGDFSPLAEAALDRAPEVLRARVKPNPGGGLYLGADPASPVVGDARVTFSAVRPGLISVVGKQSGATFAVYRTAAGGDLQLLETGTHSAGEMFAQAEQSNRMFTWMARLGGFLLMSLGLGLVARPLRVVADVLPMAGRVVGMGLGLFAFLVAGIGSTATIAVAWVFYRPAIGISVLVLTVLLLVWLGRRLVRAKAPAGAPPPLE